MKNVLKNLLVPVANPLLSKVHRYKNAYKGQSCYLIGGGISIKWFDLKEFSNKISMPCQFIPFHNDFNELQVEHLLLPEPWFFYPFYRGGIHGRWLRNYFQIEYRKIINENPDKNFFINLSNYPVVRSPNVTYLFRDFNDSSLPDNFITNRINPFEGSLSTSISMAVYMGFDHIYLVGYDYTHVPSRSLHWFEKGQGLFIDRSDYGKDLFSIAREFVDITTITLDGTSEFINAVTYKEHTGKDPFYKENTDIFSDHLLKIFATWPDYNIY